MRIERLSPSAFKCHNQCPFKYFLQYHLRISGDQTFAADYGSVIHEILERYAQAKKYGTDARWQEKNKTGKDGLNCEELEEIYVNLLLENGFRSESMKALWPNHRYIRECKKSCETCEFHQDGICGIVQAPVEDISGYDPEDPKNKGKKAHEKIERFDFGCPLDEFREGVRQIEDVIFDDKPYGPFAEGKEIIATERYFRLKIIDGEEEFLATGVIDLVVKINRDTVEVMDYKTGRYKMSYPDAVQDIQLLMYYYAAKRLYPTFKNHLVTIYYLCGGKKQITPPFGTMDIHTCKRMLIDRWRTIRADKAPKRRCDPPQGTGEFDFKCENLCDTTLCSTVHPRFMEFLARGGDIEELSSVEELILRVDGNDANEEQEEDETEE